MEKNSEKSKGLRLEKRVEKRNCAVTVGDGNVGRKDRSGCEGERQSCEKVDR